MRTKVLMSLTVVSALLFCVAAGSAAEWGLEVGTPDLKSVGPLAFGPDGILLVGDTKAATVFAIETGDTSGSMDGLKLNLPGLNIKVAELLGSSPQNVFVQDLAVNPLSGNIYLSVSNIQKSTVIPALIHIDTTGKLSHLSLKQVAFSKVALPNPPEDNDVRRRGRIRNKRNDSITDLAYVDGKVIVSGLSGQTSPSTLREIPFPFVSATAGTMVEIYHGAHGRFEDYAAVRTFVPFNIDGEPNLLAAYVCTPLVKFPVRSLLEGTKIRGTTLAELGNRNRPLDMIVYQKSGKEFLLLANSNRGVIKISTEDIQRQDGITERISGGGTAGQTYETITDLKGVVQLDRIDNQNVALLVQTDSGTQDLRTVTLP